MRCCFFLLFNFQVATISSSQAWSPFNVPCWNPCVGGHILSQEEAVGLSHPPCPLVDFYHCPPVDIIVVTVVCLDQYNLLVDYYVLQILTVWSLQVLLVFLHRKVGEFWGAWSFTYNWQIFQICSSVILNCQRVKWSGDLRRMVVDVPGGMV